MKLDVILYADDLILFSDTRKGFQKMLDKERIGLKIQIKFNPDKTNYLVVNNKLVIKSSKYLNDDVTLTMDGLPIEQLFPFNTWAA